MEINVKETKRTVSIDDIQVGDIFHVSCVLSNYAWVVLSDINMITIDHTYRLTNMTNQHSFWYIGGKHTVDNIDAVKDELRESAGELIIGENYFPTDKTTITLKVED